MTLITGTIVNELPSHIKVGRYVLSLADQKIYFGEVNFDGHISWETITSDPNIPQYRIEDDYFRDESDKHLYAYVYQSSTFEFKWQKVCFTGQTDDGINLYFVKNGCIRHQIPMSNKNIVYSVSVPDGTTTYAAPLQNSYPNIAFDKDSDVFGLPILNDTESVTVELAGFDGYLNPSMIYYEYNGAEKITYTCMFIFPVPTPVTVTLTNVSLDENTYISEDITSGIIYRNTNGIIVVGGEENIQRSNDLIPNNTFGYFPFSGNDICFTSISKQPMKVRLTMAMTGVYTTSDHPTFVYAFGKDQQSSPIGDNLASSSVEMILNEGNKVFYGWTGGIGFNGKLKITFSYISPA